MCVAKVAARVMQFLVVLLPRVLEFNSNGLLNGLSSINSCDGSMSMAKQHVARRYVVCSAKTAQLFLFSIGQLLPLVCLERQHMVVTVVS